MPYVPLNLDVYTAAYAGAIAGIGIPSGAFIVDPTQADYAPVTVVAAAFAQAFDTAWGATPVANLYDIQAITDAVCNTFVKGSGAPLTGPVTTQANWTTTATAIVALIKEGDAAATTGGIVFPTDGGSPFPIASRILAASPVYGSDTTGNGSLSKPYATIAKCYSIASPTASVAQHWEVILLPGTYVENVALRPFINLVGWDPSAVENDFYPAHVQGNWTLDASFSVAGAIASISNTDVDGTNTLNFGAVGSADGTVSFSNCQFENVCTFQMPGSAGVEMHDCVLLANVDQIGGSMNWWNTNGIPSNGLNQIVVQGTLGVGAIFQASGGVWPDNFLADASLNAGADVVQIHLYNFSIEGRFDIVASATVNPTVISDFGSILENVSLVGAAAGLSPQMRIVHQFTIPAGTAIAANDTTPIPLTVPAILLGTTSIESLVNVADSIGVGWTAIFTTEKCSVSWQFVKNGANNQVIANVSNPGAGFNTAADLLVTWFGYVLQPAP